MLDAVGVFGVNFENDIAVFHVFAECRGNDCNIGTFLLRLPYGVTGFHTHNFCRLTFRQHDTVPLFRIAADRNGFSLVFGV